MNLEQYYLGKLAEEAVEVAQRALKTQQFGMLEVQKGQELNNRQRLCEELNDLYAILFILNKNYNLGFYPNRKKCEDKIVKVEKFLDYSKTLGRVDSE